MRVVLEIGRLTSCANFFLVDGPDLNGLRDALQVDGVISAEVAAVLQLSVAPAVESSGVVAEPLAVARAPGEEDVVHGDDGDILLGSGVAAVRQCYREHVLRYNTDLAR